MEVGDLFGDGSVTVEEDLLFLGGAREGLPQEEREEVQPDDRERDVWRALGGVRVSEGDHEGGIIPSRPPGDCYP